MNPTVYLSGPIASCTFDECTSWRDYAVKSLEECGIAGISPMRGKDYFKDHGSDFRFSNRGNYEQAMSQPISILTRDKFDTKNAGVVLVNLIGSTKVSIGTVMEIAWANAFEVPVILCMEQENIHYHPILNSCAGYWVSTLDEGLDIAKAMLAPYVLA